MDALFHDDLKRLRDITEGCGEDVHEPDEQGLTAKFGPRKNCGFDNACCGEPKKEYESDMGFWLIRDGRKEWFNLACIIALARKAKL